LEYASSAGRRSMGLLCLLSILPLGTLDLLDRRRAGGGSAWTVLAHVGTWLKREPPLGRLDTFGWEKPLCGERRYRDSQAVPLPAPIRYTCHVESPKWESPSFSRGGGSQRAAEWMLRRRRPWQRVHRPPGTPRARAWVENSRPRHSGHRTVRLTRPGCWGVALVQSFHASCQEAYCWRPMNRMNSIRISVWLSNGRICGSACAKTWCGMRCTTAIKSLMCGPVIFPSLSAVIALIADQIVGAGTNGVTTMLNVHW
jgi:hypothetical protein